MSSGDIDDKLGPEGELASLRQQHPDLNAYLESADDLPIIRSPGIPYGAGISNDGTRRYVHDDLDTSLDGVDISPALATHESVEWALRKFCGIGEDYAEDPSGHRLANRAEYEKLTEIFNEDGEEEEEALWERYDDLLDPQISALEHAEIIAPPPDLAMYPYEADETLYNRIREAQRNT